MATKDLFSLICATLLTAGVGFAIGGEGSFVLVKHAIDTDIEEADGQSFADITGDGRGNIVAGTGDGGEVYWYERMPDGAWQRHLVADDFLEVEGTISADFNNDGQIEIVILDQASRRRNVPNVWIAKQDNEDPRKNWSKTVIDADAPHVQQGIAFDVSGNGLLDIVYAYEGIENGEGGFYWLENRGGNPLNARNWIKHEIDQVEGAWWIDRNSPKDFNGNGEAKDILVGVRAGGRAPSNAKGGIYIYNSPANPRERWRREVVDDNYPALHVSSGDLTGDGDDRDVVAGASHDSSDRGLFIYEFQNNWRKTAVEESGSWWGTYAFDINGNGRAEIISGRRQPPRLIIFAYDSEDGGYVRKAVDKFRKPDDQIIFADITGDGLKHEFFVGSDPDGLFWLRAYQPSGADQ